MRRSHAPSNPLYSPLRQVLSITSPAPYSTFIPRHWLSEYNEACPSCYSCYHSCVHWSGVGSADRSPWRLVFGWIRRHQGPLCVAQVPQFGSL